MAWQGERRRTSLWVWGLIFLVLTSGCLSTDPPHAPTTEQATGSPFTTGSSFTHANWSVPWDGDLVVRIMLIASEPTECSIDWAAWGVSDHLRPTFGMLVENSDDEVIHSFGRGQGNLMDSRVQVHAAGIIEQQVPEGSYPWTDRENDTFPLAKDEPLRLTVVAVGLQSEDAEGLRPPHAAMAEGDSVQLLIDCAEVVELIEVGLGTIATIFDESSFKGGAGAHIHLALSPTGATLASTIEQEVVSERGLMVVDLSGDILLNHVALGLIEITHPDGTHTLVDHPTQTLIGCETGLACPMTTFLHESGPGTYSVTATFASIDNMGRLSGALIGYDLVESLPQDPSL